MNATVSPSFFILGAPKCGTTALASYLAAHPDIEMSTPKEPHYFPTDLRVSRVPAKTLADYESLCFTDRAVAARGDASVWHLYSREAVPRIIEAYPDAKFVVMLRHPAEMAHSLHSQHVFFGKEDQQDFATAWRLCAERRAGRCLPPLGDYELRCMLYDDVAQFGEQLGRLFARVDPSRVLIVLNEEMKRDVRGVYRNVLAFLQVPDDSRATFPPVNDACKVRNARLARILRSRVAYHFALAFKRLFGLASLGIGKPQPPLPSDLRDEIARDLSSDIEQLEGLIGRCLPDWRSAPSDRRAA